MVVKLCSFLGLFFGFIWCHLVRVRRSTVKRNLDLAFGNSKSVEEKELLLRENFNYYGRHFFETLLLPLCGQSLMNKQVVIADKDYAPFRALKAQGKGAFILTAHLGNWEFSTRMSIEKKVPLSIVTKKMKSTFLHKVWFFLRGTSQVEYIDAEGTARDCLRAVKGGRFVAMMLDQHMQPPVGVETEFFGHAVGTIRSLAHLSLRSGVPVIPLYVVREDDGRYHLYSEEPVTPPAHVPRQTSAKEALIRRMTQEYCAIIEQWVRQYPEQWNWLHRRFKYSHNYDDKAFEKTPHPASLT